MSLTTLADLEERLAITGTNPADLPDAYLNNLIDRADDLIVQVVGREIESATFTEYVSGDGTKYLNLRRGPLTSVTSVSSVVYAADGTPTATALDAGSYRLHGNDANWKLPGWIEADSWTWVTGAKNYKVIYVAGWTSVPDDIAEAALHTCVWMLNKRKDAGTESRSVAEGTLSGLQNLSALMADLHTMLFSYIPQGY